MDRAYSQTPGWDHRGPEGNKWKGEIQDETQQTLAFRDETKSMGSTKEAKKEYPSLVSNQEIV